MPDSDGPDLVDPHPNVLADVKSGSVSDNGQADGSSPPEDAVEELRAVAEELREERERLEWTANQVAHLVEHRPGPSADPDPTPPAPIDLQEVAATAAVADGQVQAPGEAMVETAETAETADPDVLAAPRRGGGLVTVLGVVMLILAAAVLMSRAVA